MRLAIFVALISAPSIYGQTVGDSPKSSFQQIMEPYEPSPEAARAQFELEMTRAKTHPVEFQVIVSALQVGLARFGYGTRFTGDFDDNTKQALREYQKYSGLRPTGEIDYDTWTKLDSDYLDDKEPVILPPFYIDVQFWKQGIVAASGTWVSKDEKESIGLPLQTSEIRCERDRAICIESTAEVLTKGASKSLHVQQDVYEVERWDEFEIVTKPIQAACTRNILRVNRIQQSVTAVRSTISDADECAAIGKADWLTELQDGSKVYRAEMKIFQDANRKVLRVGENFMGVAKVPKP